MLRCGIYIRIDEIRYITKDVPIPTPGTEDSPNKEANSYTMLAKTVF